MDNVDLTDRVLTEQQNKFRGLVAEFKSRKFVEGRTFSPARIFRNGLREIFLGARLVLTPGQMSEFISWVAHQTETQIPELARIPVGYDDLSGVVTSPPAPLERELLWVAERLKAHIGLIKAFRAAANHVECLAYDGKYDHAIEHLELIDAAFGVSLWSVQLRICFEHLAGGLERQKRYTAEVRKVFKRGLLGFVAYHTSVRNEDKTTLAKFVDDIKGRIDGLDHFTPQTRTYLKYRLAGEWPRTDAGLAEVICVEQSHTTIDLYESFIGLAQELARRERSDLVCKAMATCLQKIESIEDFRIAKALLLLGRSTSSVLPSRDTAQSDLLFGGNVANAIRRSRNILKSVTSVDVWSLIYFGYALANLRNIPSKEFRDLRQIAKLIGTIQQRGRQSEQAYAQLEKIAQNMRALPICAAVVDVLRIMRRSFPNEQLRPWLIGLNSPSLGVEDQFPMLPDAGAVADLQPIPGAITITDAVWLALRNPDGMCEQISLSASEVRRIFQAAGMLNKHRSSEAIDCLRGQYEKPKPKLVRSLLAQLLLYAYFDLGDRRRLIALVADEGTRTEASREFLPILSSLESCVWSDYSQVEIPISASIALHMLWTKNENDKTASMLRYSLGFALRQLQLDRPSQILDRAGDLPMHQLIYFLKHVCVQQVLDVSRGLKGSRDVAEERQEICAQLRDLDPENKTAYQDERITIMNSLAMADGQWIVDRSRIHVDIEAFSRWATKELSEDFARYRDLLDVEVGTAQNFDDVLRELTSNTLSPKQLFDPDNEADAVLLSILRRLCDEFLTNPNFGLDFYLSKRIRHQSFIGAIRGPLEFAGLITTKESETGSYHRNDLWLDRFCYSSDNIKHEIDLALTSAATAFDNAMQDAKDSRFHVRSSEKPEGLIYIELSLQLLALARAVVRLDFSFQELFATVVNILWGALEPSLTSARQFISTDLKGKAAKIFDELRASVRRLAEHDPVALEFDMEVGRRSTEVQRALDEVVTWFTHTNVDAPNRQFTLKQALDVCIEAALKCQRAFEPVIEIEAYGELRVLASTLVFAHDVLFVALDNIRRESGIKKPHVKISISADIDAETLQIEVVNEGKYSNRAATERKLVEIRQLIDKGTAGRRTRGEGGSGFLKLGAVVGQSSKGKIEFGFVDDTHFRLVVTFSILIEEVPLEESVDG